jgi:hypothetical protein
MLHRFLSADTLPPDFSGSTSPPEVVIRQVATSIMQVWDIREGHVLFYDGISHGLLSCFDPNKSVYLYELGRSLEEPFFEELSIPTMCSVSPNEIRYKEFHKNEAVKIYMPKWTLP